MLRVLALSLALWTGEHKPAPSQGIRVSVPKGRLPTLDEMIASRLRRRSYF